MLTVSKAVMAGSYMSNGSSVHMVWVNWVCRDFGVWWDLRVSWDFRMRWNFWVLWYWWVLWCIWVWWRCGVFWDSRVFVHWVFINSWIVMCTYVSVVVGQISGTGQGQTSEKDDS